MELPQGLIPEIERARARAAKAKTLDAKAELTQNVYPLLQMMTQVFGQYTAQHEERLSQAEIAIAELATSGDSIILPDLADSIESVLQAGIRLCDVVEAAQNEELGDEERDAARDQLLETATEYRKAVDELRAELDDVIVDDDDDDDDSDDAGANGADKKGA